MPTRRIRVDSDMPVILPEYWLSPCPDFVNQELKDCVRIIHGDIIEIWNMNDKNRVWSFPWSSVIRADLDQYLSSNKFKARMSHVVKDLAGSSNASSK